MTLLYIVLLFGATIRLTRLVTVDVIAERPRCWIERHVGDKLEYLVRCPWCASWWVGLIVFVVGYYAPSTPVTVVASALTASLFAGYAAMLEGLVDAATEHMSTDGEPDEYDQGGS